MSENPKIFRNAILNALSAPDLDLLWPDLKPVELKVRDRLEAARQPISNVYFIEDGLTSVVARSNGDRIIEVGLIGRDGMTGLTIVLGDGRAANETFVQVAGSALMIDSAKLKTAMETSPTLRLFLLRFVQAFLSQASHTALANGRAKIEERLARWVLMANDRLDGDKVALTHEFLALMLGVRRPGVTAALHFLEGRGPIKSARGLVSVIDRDGLIEVADGSYGGPEAEYARLFGG